jgi:hypothetical protein
MKNQNVEIVLTAYKSVKITIEERKRDLESSIVFWTTEKASITRRFKKKIAGIDLDIENKKAELALIEKTLHESRTDKKEGR